MDDKKSGAILAWVAELKFELVRLAATVRATAAGIELRAGDSVDARMAAVWEVIMRCPATEPEEKVLEMLVDFLREKEAGDVDLVQG